MYNPQYRPVSYRVGNNNNIGAPMGSTSGPGMGSTTGPAAGGTGTYPPAALGIPFSPQGTAMVSPANITEQSFIENILRLNLGKVGTFYMTYENNREWNAKIFKGVLEAAGRDHIIISDPNTGMRTILLMVNLDFATFDQPLIYQYPGVIGNPPAQSGR
ncbi:spore coat protein GerQ [Paenibacillus sp. YPG26]|uniref:spore coat protein GerQ n=1 Tax=Paenibacillus sp. YPG26 TaxID=2878915 RepID=UPI00203C615A|nr:spore coat protein GerQ [Paenibacillus sp. YPG26]USB31605.1 spore coat protein GerQ [Paenibacillus sp. YPG26]